MYCTEVNFCICLDFIYDADEMFIAPLFEYNPRIYGISGFVNNGKSRERKLAALVFMVRGIQKKNYKQPVAYTFCSGSTSATELTR